MQRQNFEAKFTPGAFLTFLPTYSLRNRLVSLLKLTGKNSETTR